MFNIILGNFVKINLLRSRKPGNLLILTPSLILLKSMASMAFSTRGMLSQMNPAMITSVVHSERRIPCNSNVCEQNSEPTFAKEAIQCNCLFSANLSIQANLCHVCSLIVHCICTNTSHLTIHINTRRVQPIELDL